LLLSGFTHGYFFLKKFLCAPRTQKVGRLPPIIDNSVLGKTSKPSASLFFILGFMLDALSALPTSHQSSGEANVGAVVSPDIHKKKLIHIKEEAEQIRCT